ncbi:trehalose 6-phosphatase [Neorhizobium alkalisoli]|uniref:Trehalose 6-phosphate phosphatase n=2 Tax=Neorhizobium alkalisoli TaxID=528178 RepID=A0A561QRM4_9HYPH|nr:trehalose 6-phosphatase [Neorhizobium alkalisoli]
MAKLRPKSGGMNVESNSETDVTTSPAERILSELKLNPENWALFLDIDGTLIDLAETPDGIVVPESLPRDLHRLSELLGGRLALVTGRALPYADRLFSPCRFPIAGLHGAERRSPSGRIERIEPGAEFERIKRALETEARDWPGVLIEDKGLAVAAHYRQAPNQKDAVETAMVRYLGQAGADFTLQRGKMVVEIRPSRASKGDALRAFLEEAPFAGAKPIAIGDDVTDEAMFKVANELGGSSIRIAENASGTEAQAILPSAARLREIIAALAASAQ